MAKKKSQVPAKRAAAGALVDTSAYDVYGKRAGWETTNADDFAVPFLNLLQSNSPQVKKKHELHVPGAEAGMMIDSVTNRLYDGDDGAVIVPVHLEKKIVEWVPRDDGGGGGAGFVAAHSPQDPMVIEALQKANGDKRKMTSPDGNDLVETKYLYCLILDDEGEFQDSCMIAFSKTKLQPLRLGLSTIRKAKGSGEIPLFANRLRLTTVLDSNNQGQDYYNFKLEPAEKGETPQDAVVNSRLAPMVDGELNPVMQMAMGFREAVAAGSVKVDYGQDVGGGGKGAESKDGVF